MKDFPRPDAVLLILDATNLGRSLVLAAPVLSLGLPTIVILNMADELHARGGEVNPEALGRQLGAPVVLVERIARRGTGTGLEVSRRAQRAAPPDRSAAASRRAEVPRLGREHRQPRRLSGAGRAGMDTPPGCDFPAPLVGTGNLRRGCRGGVPDDLLGCAAANGRLAGTHHLVRPARRSLAAGFALAFAADRRASGAVSARCSCSCRRFCCCFCSSESWKIPDTWRVRP